MGLEDRDLLGLGDLLLPGVLGLEPLVLCDFSRPPLLAGLAERGDAAAPYLSLCERAIRSRFLRFRSRVKSSFTEFFRHAFVCCSLPSLALP